MKLLLLTLLFPFVVFAQTVHLDDKEIEYKDKVKLPGMSKAEVFDRATKAIGKLVNTTGKPLADTNEFEYKVNGEIYLTTPHPIIRKVKFRLSLSAQENGYSYKIDKVSLWEKHRGKDVKEMSSEDLVDQMDESGNPAIDAEHILNAIDLNLQKLLTLLEKNIKSQPAGNTDRQSR